MPTTGLVYRDASLALQKGIRDRLNDAMQAQDGGPVHVYDDIEEDTPYPYIRVSDQETTGDFSTKGRSGQEVTIGVDIWSRWGGRAEAGRLASEATQKITEAPISVPGWEIVRIDRIGSTHLEEPDATHHWVLRFRVKISDLVAVN